MRRRVLLLSSLGLLSVAACASVLGDFDVETNAATTGDGGPTTDGSSSGVLADGSSTDGSITDGSNPDGSSTSSSSSSGGTLPDAGPATTPIITALATSLNATCATIQYRKSSTLATFCWGEASAATGLNGVGAVSGDRAFGNPDTIGIFHRPRTATGPTAYITFDTLAGGASGDWFLGHGAVGGGTGYSYAWGDNSTGQCALGPTSVPVNGQSSSCPPTVLKAGGGPMAPPVVGSGFFPAPGTGCVTASNGTASNTPYCWGRNDECQATPQQAVQGMCAATTPESSLQNEMSALGGDDVLIDKIVGGVEHMCVARHSSTGKEAVLCWGDNENAQIGQGPYNTKTGGGKNYFGVPTVVNVTPDVGKFELASGDNHVCLLDSSGGSQTLACWGLNDNQQAVPGAGQSANSVGLGVTTVSNTAFKDGTLSNLALGGNLSCIVFSTPTMPGHAYCWGAGARGTNNSPTNVTQIPGIQEVSQLAVSGGHACAIASSTTPKAGEGPGVWCWGDNSQGQTDPSDLATTTLTTPVQIQFPGEADLQ